MNLTLFASNQYESIVRFTFPLKLSYLVIFCYFIYFGHIGVILNDKFTRNYRTDNGVDVVTNKQNLIEHSTVPFNVIYSLYNIYTASVFPELKDSYILFIFTMCFSWVFLITLLIFLFSPETWLTITSFFVICFCLIITLNVLQCYNGIIRFYEETFTSVLFLNGLILMIFFSPFYVVHWFSGPSCFKRPVCCTKFKKKNQICRYFFLVSISILVSSICCALFTIIVHFVLVQISVHSIPYVYLIMASIVYFLKINKCTTRWHQHFFKSVQEIVVQSEGDSSSKMQSSQQFRVVPSSSKSQQIRNGHLHAHGVPVFKTNSTQWLTKPFYQCCINISNNMTVLQNNSMYICLTSVKRLFFTYVFMIIISWIIHVHESDNFGDLSTPYIVSIGGGVFPFFFDFIIDGDIEMPDISKDDVFMNKLKDLITNYKESFPIERIEGNGSQQDLDTNSGVKCDDTTVSIRL